MRGNKPTNMPSIDSGASSTFDRYRPIFQKKEEEVTSAYNDVIIKKMETPGIKEHKTKKHKKKHSNKAMKDMMYYLLIVVAIAGFSALAFKLW